MNRKLLGAILGAAIASYILPVRAESCVDYFNRNNLRYEETTSQDKRIYMSWNGGELIDCNTNGDNSFVCGGKSYSYHASSVYDNSGTSWDIKWNRISDVYNCNRISDGTFVTTNDETYRGIVENANISVGKVQRLTTRYRVIRPDF